MARDKLAGVPRKREELTARRAAVLKDEAKAKKRLTVALFRCLSLSLSLSRSLSRSLSLALSLSRSLSLSLARALSVVISLALYMSLSHTHTLSRFLSFSRPVSLRLPSPQTPSLTVSPQHKPQTQAAVQAYNAKFPDGTPSAAPRSAAPDPHSTQGGDKQEGQEEALPIEGGDEVVIEEDAARAAWEAAAAVKGHGLNSIAVEMVALDSQERHGLPAEMARIVKERGEQLLRQKLLTDQVAHPPPLPCI